MVYGIVKNNCFIKENIVILNISFIILAFQGALCPSSISTFNSGSICKYLLSAKYKTITKNFSNLNIQCGFSKLKKKCLERNFCNFEVFPCGSSELPQNLGLNRFNCFGRLLDTNEQTSKECLPLKTTYPGQAGPNCIVNCDCLFVISHALQLNKNMKI